MEIPSRGFTHSGKFHADEVFSTALLLYLNPTFTYERGFKVPEDFEGLVYDIGWGEFDHHQADARVRENGVPYAAFGLLWEQFGADIVGEDEAKRIDALFVQPLDQSDNTGTANELCQIIESFNPVWDSSQPESEAFLDAVRFAHKILEHKFESYFAARRAENMVQEAIDKAKDQIVILEKRAPWKNLVAPTSAEYVIYPSNRGGYSVQGVPVTADSLDLKRPFPMEWRGAAPEELAKMSGVDGLRFCHKSGFLLTVDTLKEAVACCKISQGR